MQGVCQNGNSDSDNGCAIFFKHLHCLDSSINATSKQFVSDLDIRFMQFATRRLHNSDYIGHTMRITGTETTMIRISSGSPMRQ